MTLEEKKQEVIEEFSMYDEWLDRYEYLIELGKALEPYPEEEKTEEKLIKGCQSRVWLDYALEDGKLYPAGRPRRSPATISASSTRSACAKICLRPAPTALCR